MDQAPGESPAPRNETSGQRDMMFCHECHDEWYRDQHGLTCPECGSDFTEIIEENNDPRETHMFGHDDHESDEDEPMPPFGAMPPHFAPRHRGQDDDPEESDINNVHFTRLGPGRFNVQATMVSSINPHQMGHGNGPNTIGGFASFLTDLMGHVNRPSGQQGQNQDQNEGGGQGNQDNQEEGQRGRTPSSGPRISRFHYTSGPTGLHPRDANNPERQPPVEDLNNVLTGIMAAFGAPPDAPGHAHHRHHFHAFHGPGLHDFHNRDEDEEFGPPPMHPLFQLFAGMNEMMGGNGQAGDFVHSQEDLDRIISQMMDQNASSNAPGPASQSDIDALPRKPVTKDMLGNEGRAECSICMDEAPLGTEVTELPCKHWFHHQCVSAWLNEHDTCPHCRQGISKHDEPANDTPNGQAMPGAFNPPETRNSAVQTGQQQNNNQEAPAGGSGGGGGIGERLRRGWFGP